MKTGTFIASMSGFGCAAAGVVMPNYMEILRPYSDYILFFGLCFAFGPWLLWGYVTVRDRHHAGRVPQWLNGDSAMRQFNIDADQLRQCVLNGLPVYPEGDAVLYHPGEVPPIDVDDMFHFHEIEKLRFKRKDVKKWING